MFNIVLNDTDIMVKGKVLSSDKHIRTASRGIVLDKETGKIAIFYKKNMNEYKLPGGGIDLGETPKQAFQREVLEETGLTIKNIKFIGITNEVKSLSNFYQTSFCFVATKNTDTQQQHLTDKEMKEGGNFIWLDIDEAIANMENALGKLKAGVDESVYSTTFIQKRDIMILKEYKKSRCD